jgi:hypothetical protein
MGKDAAQRSDGRRQCLNHGREARQASLFVFGNHLDQNGLRRYRLRWPDRRRENGFGPSLRCRAADSGGVIRPPFRWTRGGGLSPRFTRRSRRPVDGQGLGNLNSLRRPLSLIASAPRFFQEAIQVCHRPLAWPAIGAARHRPGQVSLPLFLRLAEHRNQNPDADADDRENDPGPVHLSSFLFSSPRSQTFLFKNEGFDRAGTPLIRAGAIRREQGLSYRLGSGSQTASASALACAECRGMRRRAMTAPPAR